MGLTMVITRDTGWIRNYSGKTLAKKSDLSFILKEATEEAERSLMKM